MKDVLTLPNDLDMAAQLIEFASNFATRYRLPKGELERLLVILDELFSNIVRHGYPAKTHGVIVLCLSRTDDQLEIRIEDDGCAFNPLSVTAPDPDLSPDRRPMGGLGIHMVRSLVDGAQYSRLAASNRLILTRHLPAAAVECG